MSVHTDSLRIEIALTQTLQVLLNSPSRPINVREIAKYGDPYQRGTPWTRAGRLVSSGPFVF